MARMIPFVIDPECPSPGEREIFRRLRDEPGTDGWIALHSLDMARYRKQVSGEIDFAVVIPSKGVLCIEVKACRSLSREEGVWYYGKDRLPDSRGPFKQAARGMHSTREYLTARRPDLSRIVFWSVVIFTHLQFRMSSPEWHDWQVIDGPQFRSRPLSVLLLRVIDQAREFLASCSSTPWFVMTSNEPYPEQCKALAASLRPRFEVYESPKSRRRRLDDELKHYTQEQMIALDAMEDNPRCLFIGPAGTGKTLLAIESARRACSAGRTVLFICFNALLSQWIRDQVVEIGPIVTARTLHSHMLAVSGLSGRVDDRQDDFWTRELPELAIDSLLDKVGDSDSFDEIVIDEAQDIFRENYLDFLNLSLKGGFSSGRWRIFGDFEKQVIYNLATTDVRKIFTDCAGEHSVYSLRVNCRNTPRIAEMVRLLGKLTPFYRRVLRPDNGIEAELKFYKDQKEQGEILSNLLSDLQKSGCRMDDVAVLSPRSACVAQSLGGVWQGRLHPHDKAQRGHPTFCTIQSFKGLEAPIVIVTDIEELTTGPESEALFYIAITRALEQLYVLIQEGARRDVTSILLGKRETESGE